MTADYNPLKDAPPSEVSLIDAPLVRVIAQVMFPPIISITEGSYIAPFQEAIRDAYPVLRQEHSREVLIAPGNMVAATQQGTWRFSDAAMQWRVSLAPNFVALETTSYSSRTDFLARFRSVVAALGAQFNPRTVDRLGIRYIDRVADIDTEQLEKFVRPQLTGILATNMGEYALHSLSETMFSIPNESSKIMARWGRVPENGTPDPLAIEPIETSSWILDLDMFRAEQRPFDTEQLVHEASSFSERLYAIFRWAVTEDFLRRYGGKV